MKNILLILLLICHSAFAVKGGGYTLTKQLYRTAGKFTSTQVQSIPNDPSVPTNPQQTTFLLSPINEVSANTLVTCGLPLNVGWNTAGAGNIRVFTDTGAEVPVFAKATMLWHWKDGSPSAQKIQFLKPVVGTKTYTVRWDVARGGGFNLAGGEQPVANGLQVSTVANRAFAKEPIIACTLPVDYLRTTGLIAPYAALTTSYTDTLVQDSTAMQAAYLDPASAFDTSLQRSGFEYDRVATLYKLAMRKGDVSLWREGYRSGYFYIGSIKRTGTTDGFWYDPSSSTNYQPDPAKNRGMYEPRGYNGKYEYSEGIRMHIALTGDDSIYHPTPVNGDTVNALLADMVKFLDDNAPDGVLLNGAIAPYSHYGQGFTDRSIGFPLLLGVNAYMVNPSSTIKTTMDRWLENTWQMQVSGVALDGFPADGSWRHSWNSHENGYTPASAFHATVKAYDRTVSPWMSAIIINGLWQTYFNYPVTSTQKQRIAVMIRDYARWTTKWSHIDAYGYNGWFGSTTAPYAANSGHGINYSFWANDCNGDPGDLRNGIKLFYSARPVYDWASISNISQFDALPESDSGSLIVKDVTHNYETLFALAAGVYFETNPTEQARMIAMIDRIENQSARYCGSPAYAISSNGYGTFTRIANWMFTSNPWGTWTWVKQQKGIP